MDHKQQGGNWDVNSKSKIPKNWEIRKTERHNRNWINKAKTNKLKEWKLWGEQNLNIQKIEKEMKMRSENWTMKNTSETGPTKSKPENRKNSTIDTKNFLKIGELQTDTTEWRTCRRQRPCSRNKKAFQWWERGTLRTEGPCRRVQKKGTAWIAKRIGLLLLKRRPYPRQQLKIGKLTKKRNWKSERIEN